MQAQNWQSPTMTKACTLSTTHGAFTICYSKNWPFYLANPISRGLGGAVGATGIMWGAHLHNGHTAWLGVEPRFLQSWAKRFSHWAIPLPELADFHRFEMLISILHLCRHLQDEMLQWFTTQPSWFLNDSCRHISLWEPCRCEEECVASYGCTTWGSSDFPGNMFLGVILTRQLIHNYDTNWIHVFNFLG